MSNFTNIRTREKFREYILMRLGAPINNIEVTQDQINYVIDDSLLYFWRVTEEGSYLHYFAMPIKSGQGEICMAGLNIQGVYNLEMSGFMEGLTTLFSPMNMFYNAWIGTTGNPMGSSFPFGSSTSLGNESGLGGQLGMAEHRSSMQYLKSIENTFAKKYTLKWNPGREVMEIIPTPREDCVALVSLYVREEEEFLYDNPTFRDLVVNRAGMLWADNLSKVVGAMPDGLSIDAAGMLAKYTERATKAEEKIWQQRMPNKMMWG